MIAFINLFSFQVTILRVSENEVYVGTNRGFVFLADIKRLRPITFFRPFEQDVRSFWVFKNSKFSGSAGNLSEQNQKDNDGIIPIHSSPSSSNISNSNSKNSGSVSDGMRGSVSDITDRGISPTPSSQEEKNVSMQIVIGIGKGFSNLIEKNVGATIPCPEQRQRRKAFAMLWHIPSHFNS